MCVLQDQKYSTLCSALPVHELGFRPSPMALDGYGNLPLFVHLSVGVYIGFISVGGNCP